MPGRPSERSFQQRSGTSLPSSLLDKIQETNPAHPYRKKSKGKSVLNRKQLRKEARVQKKQKHVTLQQRKKNFLKENIDRQLSEKKQAKEEGTSHSLPSTSKSSVKSHSSSKMSSSTVKDKKVDKEREQRQLRKLAESNPAFFSLLKTSNLVPDVRGIPSLKEQEDIEDEDQRNIRALAKKLRIKKGKLTKGFVDDGLDYLLEGIGGQNESDIQVDAPDSDTESEKSSLDEELMDMSDELDSEEEIGVEDEEESDDDDLESLEIDDDEDHQLDERKIEEQDMSLDSEDEDISSADSETDPVEDLVSPPESKTNPAPGVAATRYLPPHLRKKAETESEENIRLKRQIQGLLNRLSDANMESIVLGIDEIYRNNPRQYVTEAITSTLLTFVGDHANLLESFVATYSAFVACMYNIIGIDFGAHFIQTLMERFEGARNNVLSASQDKDERSSKESSNLLLFLAYLYNFEVVSCVLIYDVIRLTLASLSEIDVEHLLKLLKICGHQLRSDDPLALKEIVLMVKEETSKRDTSTLTVRHKFMVETIMDLKNNKRKAHLANTTQLQEERLRKFIKNMINRRSLYGVEPLRVTLEDIRNIKTKGKWWLVGAAWVGHDSSKIQESVSKKQGTSHSSDSTLSRQLLEEARRQRMNTDVRRSIFVTLMSSEDCIDAFERLLKLGLKDKQERDIVRVLMHCCSQEKVFNLFYTLVSLQFCEYAHRFKITFQYALWDILKAMKENEENDETKDDFLSFQSKQGIRKTSHLARMFAFLFSKDALPLSILKVLEFTSALPPLQTLFLRTVLGWFVVNTSENLVLKAFRSLKSQPALTPLCEGLSLFIKVSMIQGLKRGEEHLMSIEKHQIELALDRFKLIRKLIE